MTELARELLEGIEVGDYVTVRYGTYSNQDSATGTVTKLTENVLTLDNGRVKLRLDDSLRSVEKRAEQVAIQTPVSKPAAPIEFQITKRIAELPPAPQYNFDIKEWLEKISAVKKKGLSSGVKNEMSGLFASLKNAVKNKELAYKYHDLRARLLNTWENCNDETDYEIFYLLLGVISVAAKEYTNSFEPLIRVKEYSLATFAANSANKTSYAEIFIFCALLEGQSKNVNQQTAKICAEKKDVELIRKLLELNKTDEEFCEKISACALAMFEASSGKLTENIGANLTAYGAASKLLEMIPSEWQEDSGILKRWQEYSQYKYPEPQISNSTTSNRLTGKIIRYGYGTGFFGKISPNYGFHVGQISDYTERGILLRKFLAAGLWNQLEVSFILGAKFNNPEQMAASDIELTDNGYAEAQKRLQVDQLSFKIHEGMVESYYPKYMNGRVRSNDNGNVYNFKLENIADPWLRAFFRNINPYSSENQDVTFEISGNNAFNICWQTSVQFYREAYDNDVSAEERRTWKKFLEDRENHVEQIILPTEDPYSSIHYIALPEWKNSQKSKKPAPLSWAKDKSNTIRPEEPARVAVISKPQETNLISHAPIIKVPEINYEQTLQAHFLADQGRSLTLEGKLNEAAQKFEETLSVGGFDEAVVGDFVSLCVRLNDTDKALKLLEKYKANFASAKEKFMNLQISVHDKRRDFKELCILYEKAFQKSVTVSKKSHYLFRLIWAHMNLKEYEQALNVCQRWEKFYQDNRFGVDAEKLKRAAGNIKRNKATCYYYTGNIAEAQKLATDILRINPQDEVAIKILDGTLTEVAISEVAVEDNSDYDGSENSDSKIPKFIQDMLKTIKISSRLKSKNLQGEEYLGTAEEVREDVNMLTFGRKNRRDFPSENIRRTAETRSEDLFAACKLVMQIDQRDSTVFNNNKRYILAGRAIASWGDYMVSKCAQIDTPRMAWLYSISLLQPVEQDWGNSFNRYLMSFLLPQSGNDSLENYIANQNNSAEKDGINTDILIDKKIHASLRREFLTGILNLMSSLKPFPNHRTNLATALYKKNPELCKALTEELAAVLNAEKADSQKGFVGQIDEAINLMNKQQQRLQDVLIADNTAIKNSSLLENQFFELEAENWSLCLTSTDAERLRKILFIFKRVQDYHSSYGFDNRTDLLAVALSFADELLKTIRAEPTIISYTIFYPMLERFKNNFSEKQDALYQSFQPKLSWSEKLQPFRTLDGQIQIQLTVKNEVNYQTAEAFQIVGVRGIQGSEVKLRNSGGTFSIRGGDEIEIVITVVIGEAENKIGSFGAEINYSYKCGDSPKDIVTMNKTEKFTFIILNEDFKPLKNPLFDYIGKPMDNEAMFIGRTNEIERIVNAICQDDGTMNYSRAIAMYGQTRTGKSSILWHLRKKLMNKYGDKILIWDMGNIGDKSPNLKNSLEEDSTYMATFLSTLLYKGSESFWDNDEVLEMVQERDLKSPHDLILEKPHLATTLFTRYMSSLSSLLRKKNKIIVLLIDEFTYLHDQIKRGNISTEFMRFWKAMLQNYTIFAIIAGQDDMPEFMKEYPNEFISMEPLKLTYLQEADAKRLIREPLERANKRTDLFIDEEPIDEIYKLTAGSAYLTIVLCSFLVNYLNEKGAYKITKGIVNDFLNTRAFGHNSFLTEAYFEAQLQERGHRELDNVNKEILHCIAKLSQKTGYADINDITCSGEYSNKVPELVERLVDRNVLVKEGGNHYLIQVKLLELWLIRTMGV